MSIPTSYLVRHGAMRFLGEFRSDLPTTIHRSIRVIVRSERGMELGEVVCPSTPEMMAALPEATRGELIRVATTNDLDQHNQQARLRDADFATAERLIRDHRLVMQLVDVERLFGGERILFYYLAEGRVDFRELVKSLAREFRMRIELRQIGVRDEAKLLADYGDCGQPVCCNSHLVAIPRVSMRMAKLQKASLDPNKISGRCGRLKCCLRFEQDVYEELQASLPDVGQRIVTKIGNAKVLAQEVLSRRLLVEFEDGRRLPIAADEVLTRL